jgi:hypothetical protein
MIVGKVLKTDTRNAFVIIKGLIVVYAGLNICYYYIVYFSPSIMFGFWGRANGSYSFVYYLMLVPNTLLPLLLLFKNPGRNKYVLLALSFLLNIGWMFELFVIYSTDLHSDHIATQPSFNYLWFIVLNGVFIGSVIYAIGRAVKCKMPEINAPL